MTESQSASNAERDRRFAALRDWVAVNDTGTLITHRYGDHPEQVADLRIPTGPGPHPLAVLIHGGNWRTDRTRATIAPLAVDLHRRGWITWNIEYRRIGTGGGVEVTSDDVATAICAVDTIECDIDLDRAVVIGHSSGGQLALMSARQRNWAAVVALSGYCDLEMAWRQRTGAGAVELFCGGSPLDVPEAYRSADPSAQLPLRRRLVVAHGDADDRVPLAQSVRFADAARRAGDFCNLILAPGADHFDLIDPRTQVWGEVVNAL